ncbi:MAG: hypothetical protein L3J19_03815 [Sulfurimonas sp.]|nr:hypothetical protein [Sulfurimonas sp.]
MKGFKLSVLIFTSLLTFFGCSSPKILSDICSTCNMHINDSKLHTASLDAKNSIHYFDDIGCMILFAKKNQLDLNQIESKVFTNDTKRYINSSKAYYTTYENTPMGYGFSAYEKEQPDAINFDKVIINMLRGEHMANPKIRKLILGSKV